MEKEEQDWEEDGREEEVMIDGKTKGRYWKLRSANL